MLHRGDRKRKVTKSKSKIIRESYLAVSSVTVASMNSVDLSFKMTWQSSASASISDLLSKLHKPTTFLIAPNNLRIYI